MKIYILWVREEGEETPWAAEVADDFLIEESPTILDELEEQYADRETRWTSFEADRAVVNALFGIIPLGDANVRLDDPRQD